MNRTDRAGTVTHRSGNTLHRLCPDISGREDSRAGRFERQRIEIDIAEIAVGKDESLGIKFHEASGSHHSDHPIQRLTPRGCSRGASANPGRGSSCVAGVAPQRIPISRPLSSRSPESEQQAGRRRRRSRCRTVLTWTCPSAITELWATTGPMDGDEKLLTQRQARRVARRPFPHGH